MKGIDLSHYKEIAICSNLANLACEMANVISRAVMAKSKWRFEKSLEMSMKFMKCKIENGDNMAGSV
jgi:hypothetical protein